MRSSKFLINVRFQPAFLAENVRHDVGPAKIAQLQGAAFDHGAESQYDGQGGLRFQPLGEALAKPTASSADPNLLPPRSMVGQLPLEQPIGVRIPGGQPIKSIT